MTSNTRDAMRELKFYSDYSRTNETTGMAETWDQSVDRVMDMHEKFYANKLNQALHVELDKARQAYKDKLFLGSQRALQFGGEPMFKHQARMFNCLSSYCDRVQFFRECMYWLMCGCGVGFSVQKHHINKMPNLNRRDNGAESFTIPDSIEGWADAFGILIDSYTQSESGQIDSDKSRRFEEFHGKEIHFDYSLIRPKGSMISGGFKAPGPDGLRQSLNKVEELIERELHGLDTIPFRSIIAYDIVMWLADAVLSGGVRRSATIALFSKDDDEMANAKIGNWFNENPQRGRSNNSAILLRDSTSAEEFAKLMQSVRDFGEPGFIWTDDEDITFNPCVEIGKYPQTATGKSGWQGCNLCEINGGACTTEELFYQACEAAAIVGTLQAGYTNFKYVAPESKAIFDREALLGVSITGWMNNPDVLFDSEVQRKGAQIVKDTNRRIAAMIGINPAARTTCVKPSGNASVLLGTASGIHGEHAPRYFRNMQMNKKLDAAQLFRSNNPNAVEESVWSTTGSDWIMSIPVESPDGSIYKDQLYDTKQMEFVKNAQQNWVEHGTNVELCAKPYIRHNVSNTIVVSDWDAVESYLYENRQWFAGISFLSASGDKDYPQAPFTQVFDHAELLRMYGEASMFASGLIVDGLHAFNNNLWQSCDHVLYGMELEQNSENVLKIDWVRRARKFADTYFDSDIKKMTYCLKDVYNYHKWCKIKRNWKEIDWTGLSAVDLDVDTTTAQACAGGICDLSL